MYQCAKHSRRRLLRKQVLIKQGRKRAKLARLVRLKEMTLVRSCLLLFLLLLLRLLNLILILITLLIIIWQTGPRWKGEFWFVPWAVRWTAHELVSANCFFKTLPKRKQSCCWVEIFSFSLHSLQCGPRASSVTLISYLPPSIRLAGTDLILLRVKYTNYPSFSYCVVIGDYF